jgi:hypothetical protein
MVDQEGSLLLALKAVWSQQPEGIPPAIKIKNQKEFLSAVDTVQY